VRSGGANLALVLFAAARFSMAAAGPASAGFVGLIGFEDRFDSGDPAVAELPGLGVEYFVGPLGREHHFVGQPVGAQLLCRFNAPAHSPCR